VIVSRPRTRSASRLLKTWTPLPTNSRNTGVSVAFNRDGPGHVVRTAGGVAVAEHFEDRTPLWGAGVPTSKFSAGQPFGGNDRAKATPIAAQRSSCSSVSTPAGSIRSQPPMLRPRISNGSA
jgi:hypothetical protein